MIFSPDKNVSYSMQPNAAKYTKKYDLVERVEIYSPKL
jgi:hypothetical protein